MYKWIRIFCLHLNVSQFFLCNQKFSKFPEAFFKSVVRIHGAHICAYACVYGNTDIQADREQKQRKYTLTNNQMRIQT